MKAKFEGVSIYDLLKSPKLELARVKMSGEQVELAAPLGSTEYGSVDGDYVYVKLPATKENERYMISGYRVNGGLGTGISVLCRGKSAPAFAIKPGEVVYVGDIFVSQDGIAPGFRLWWSWEFSRNTLAALDALTQKHPNLATYMTEARLDTASPDFGGECRKLTRGVRDQEIERFRASTTAAATVLGPGLGLQEHRVSPHRPFRQALFIAPHDSPAECCPENIDRCTSTSGPMHP